MAEILIGGDICPINRNAEMFIRGDASGIFGDLLPEFERADLAVANLECPLIEQCDPILKVGPVLGADRKAVAALKASRIALLNLANNHVLDHGESGLMSTIAACTDAGIATIGAGEDLRRAGEWVIREVGGVRIGFLAYAEREFSVAGKRSAGANPLSLTGFVRSVRALRERVDYLIVLLHGGIQHFPYPSPQLQDVCRFMVEEGAGAVICQHSHCAGCFEEYAGGHIVYGQGNLVFDRYPGRSESFYTGYLVRLSVACDLSSKMEIIPFRQSDQRPGARRMDKEEGDAFLQQLRQMSRQLEDADFVETQWTELCKRKKYDFFSTLSGHGRILRFVNRKTHLSDILYSRRTLAGLRNIVTCESHKEMLEKILTL